MTAHALLPPAQFDSLEQALKHYFGYDRFRLGQKSVIEAVLNHQDTLVIMPTGGGKSLCYQLPALLKPGLTVVVSPLIALMQDQVQALNDNGIGATFLNSTLTGAEARQRENQILNGEIKLLYLAPERLLGERFLPFLDHINTRMGIAGFAIDEAHCVSEWGHDFRPEYRQIRAVRQRYPNVPFLGLTATATERVRQDILTQLELRSPHVHVSSFNRTNLFYEVRPKPSKFVYGELLQMIRKTPGSGIVYCLSRKRVDELTFRLQQDGIAVLPYHAGMSDRDRATNQTRFIRDDVRVMVATIAFGMGINKPDVRFVIHYDLPRNLESYYQESGRAGRDGEPAICTLFFGPGDIKTIEYLIAQKLDPQTGEPLEDEQQIARQQLRQVIDYAEGLECRRTIQLGYFGERFEGNCRNCDNCLSPRPLEDWTLEAMKFLSCVARCHERFGMKYIIDVLRGSKDKRILQNGHDRLSTYGIGKDRSMDAWRALGRSLLHQGLLDETTDGYSILKLNAGSWEVMRRQRSVLVALTNTPNATVPEESDRPSDQVEKLFEDLRTLRKRVADEESVPPYVVFSDNSLRLMAQKIPCTMAAFGKISGVGSHKRTKYGRRFIDLIRQFCEDHGIPVPAESPLEDDRPVVSQTSALSRSHLTTLELYQQGYAPEAIAEQRGVKVSTVMDHLALLLEAGQPIDLDALVSGDRQTVIFRAIDEVGDDALRPIRDQLGEEYSYDEIRLVRAIWRKQQQRAG